MSKKHVGAPVLAGVVVLSLGVTLCAGNAKASIPGSLANIDVGSLAPLDITYLDYDTDRNGIVDYRVVGDFDSDGVLEWSDIQAAVDGLCDPNGDGFQNASDGKLTDLNGDGVSDDPYCGTLHVLPGEWVSPTTLPLDWNIKNDDQIWLKNYQGLWFRGSGVNSTTLRTAYSRWMFCRTHHETGCGGVCSRHSAGSLKISDFTFVGLPARTWGDKNDCDGDGYPYYASQEQDYSARTHQSAIVIQALFPDEVHDVVVQNVTVTQADYNAFALGAINNLYVSDLTVLDSGGTGIWLGGVRNTYAERLHVESVDGPLAIGGITITSGKSNPGRAEPDSMRENIVLDTVTSIHNHIGIWIAAGGAGGISNLTISNFQVFEPRVTTGASSTEWGIMIQDRNCFWDEDGDGASDDPCYITDVTLEDGSVIGSPSYGFTMNMAGGGPHRDYMIRNVHFEGNGYAIGGPESHDVNLTMPGMVFEGNTVLAGDYNQDGISDLAHLVRIQADDVQVRNNTIRGSVGGGNHALVFARQSNNLTLEGNILDCTPDAGLDCVPLSLWSDVNNAVVQRNALSLSNYTGTGIVLGGNNNTVRSNELSGGRIEAYGVGNRLVANRITTDQFASLRHGIRLWGTGGYVAHNICRPGDAAAVCVDVRSSATGTTLWNNRNLTNFENLYQDWAGTATIQ